MKKFELLGKVWETLVCALYMDPKIVLDISSDEEVGFDDIKAVDVDWLLDYLRDDVKATDDCDDVVVVGEVNPKQKSKFSKSNKKDDDDDDDDCVVLEGDPDKPVSTVNDSENESDDLLIVGEKGQIACRDYPHARDQCAKFPFNSTPHEKQCDQCHCYVCDLVAPCGHWGTGMNKIDHCHASSKDEFWVNLRKNFRVGKIHVEPAPKVPLSTTLPQVSGNSSFPLLQPNPILSSGVSRTTSVRSCSPGPHLELANLIRNQRPGVDFGRSRFQPHLIQNSLGVHNNVVNQKDRGHGFGNPVSQCSASHAMFKRMSSGRVALGANRSGHLSSNINPAHTASRSTFQKGTTNGRSPSCLLNNLRGVNLDSGKHQTGQLNTGSIFSNAVPSLPQAYSQPVLQSNDSQGTHLHTNQTQNVVNPSVSNINGSWSGGTGHSDPPPPVESFLLPSAVPTFIPPVMELNLQFPITTNPDPLDIFDNWVLENQSVQGFPNGSVADGLNLSSPDIAPPPVDTGMLYFDLDTSLGSLMRTLVD